MATCVGCGFLALRNLDTRALDEAEESYRETGRAMPVYDSTGRSPHLGWEPCPVCFMMAIDFRSEIDNGGVTGGPGRIVEVLNSVRECEAYFAWRQGFSPREHKDLVDQRDERMRRLVEKQNEDHRREMEKKADRDWRIKELAVSSAISLATTVLSIGAGAVIYWLSARGGR